MDIMDIITDDMNEPFYKWKERYCIEKNIAVVRGFVIINSYITIDDAIDVEYSLN